MLRLYLFRNVMNVDSVHKLPGLYFWSEPNTGDFPIIPSYYLLAKLPKHVGVCGRPVWFYYNEDVTENLSKCWKFHVKEKEQPAKLSVFMVFDAHLLYI